MKRAYTYGELGTLKGQILDICEQVKNLNPDAWEAAHDGTFSRESRRFNDLCVQALRKVGIFAGLNGKRGDPNSKSDDILNFGLVAGSGGAQDKSGTFHEIAIIDFIINAGLSSASIGWIDQSKAAPGYFLDPEGAFGKLPGEVIIPAPEPSPTPEPNPGPSRPPTLLPSDLQPIIVALADISHRLSLVEARVNQGVTSNEFHGVSKEIVLHIDDVKGRVDRVSVPATKCKIPW